MNGSFLWILLKKGGISILLNIFDRARSRNDDYIIKNGVFIIKKTILLSKRPIPLVSATHLPKNDKFRRLLQLPAAIHAAIYHPPIKNNKKDDPSKKESSLSIYLGAITIYLFGSRPSE